MILKNFVVFEGIDGTGTTTQLRLLSEHFANDEKGELINFTQEPTKSQIGTLLRATLQNVFTLTPETVARLFATDRCEHLYGSEGIIEQLNLGKAVFSDRYLFSSLAYQTVAGAEKIAKEQNASFPLPEFLFFFDLPVEVSMERVTSRNSQLEIYEKPNFQTAVRAEYLKIIEYYKTAEPEMQITIIDASKPIEEIHQNLWSILKDLPKI